MTKQRELQVRQAAARHLTGIPAMQNASAIENLRTEIAYEEIVARFGQEEIARCNFIADSEAVL